MVNNANKKSEKTDTSFMDPGKSLSITDLVTFGNGNKPIQADQNKGTGSKITSKMLSEAI